jgi:DNA helicase-2/ATP-dependent DNA helicase PcrA
MVNNMKLTVDRINGGVSAGRRYSDYAVLYRVNELARTLETTFAKSGVPYKILGGNRFYDRKEIKDMLAYLTLTHSRSDDQRLKRVINEPKRKIGIATVEAVEKIAEQTGQYMFDVMRGAHQYDALKKSADKLYAFTEIIMKNQPEDRPSAVLDRLFVDTGYREMLLGEGIEGASRIDNVNELIAGALEYEKRCEEAGEEPTVAGYLDEIGLVSDLDKYDDDADAVVLMTIHSAKGLEFPVVFLAGMEDGIFPSDRNIGNEAEMSEERRLAYVAITRAKEKLYISYAKERTMYGRFGTGMLSCFIRKELPMSLVERDRPAFSASSFGRSNSFGGWNSGYGKTSAPQKKAPAPTASSGAGRFGVKMLPVGSVVMHQSFGEGVIVSAKDISGDVLYEVDFGTVGTKKLLATYARLTLKK